MNVSVKIRSDIGFYIGDICYVLDDRLYYGVWGDQNEFADGTFRDPDTGLEVAVAGTAYGDGCYLGSDGAEFPVDAGVIGLVPLERRRHRAASSAKSSRCPERRSSLPRTGCSP